MTLREKKKGNFEKQKLKRERPRTLSLSTRRAEVFRGVGSGDSWAANSLPCNEVLKRGSGLAGAERVTHSSHSRIVDRLRKGGWR